MAQPVKGINKIPNEIALAAFTNNIYTTINIRESRNNCILY